ncbi:MAG: endonuclease Q family protein [Candidatus Aenigmatarchaeota archaeon]
MKIIADLQIHSKYSRATSKNISIDTLANGAIVKGLNLLGSGDCTHPKWLKELKEKLKPIGDSGIYKYKIFWMITGEVNTVYEQDKKIRKVHHLFYVPNIETAEQIIDVLSKKSNLELDGRPTFNGLTSPELVEILMSISRDIIILPSHAWTPWFSVFGSKSGFDSLEECYQDQIKNIFALETGLSSDPAMNWRLSSLDKVTLMSNSDSHSANPWRLGREANVLELEELSYKEIYNAIKNKDRKKFLYTIETDPNYGKYHFTGHRSCGISLHPREAQKFNNTCPKCKRKLTVGVLQRVEELADRPEGFIPKDAIPYKTLLPLYEIISFILGEEFYSKKVLHEYNKIIEKFGNEFNVLLNVAKEELLKVTNEKIADAIIKVREGKVKYIAGSDGLYGKPVFNENIILKEKKLRTQKSLKDF